MQYHITWTGPLAGQDNENTGSVFNPARLKAGVYSPIGLNTRAAKAAGKENFMSKCKPYLTAYLSPEEYAQVAVQAGRASLSLSAFVKAVCLGHVVKSTVDQDAVLTLARINGDLGRLGGLLKMALSERAIDQVIGNNLLEDISRTRRRLEEKVKSL
jgi:hypothetical protein